MYGRLSGTCSRTIQRSVTGVRAAMDSYADAILGAQRHGGQRFDDVAGDEFKMKLLLDHGEKQRGFEHGEWGSDTDS